MLTDPGADEVANTNLKRLLAMITDFQVKVREANELLQAQLNLENPLYWRQARIPQIGVLNSGTIKYAFHGIGCRVETPEGVIDWDYGSGGRIDGFDLWRLRCFSEDQTLNYPEFRKQQILVDAFQEAIKVGLIHQPYTSVQDNLFYLK